MAHTGLFDIRRLMRSSSTNNSRREPMFATRKETPSMKRRLSLLAGLLLTLSPASRAAERLLVNEGRPQAEIVIAENPARIARLAARELQTYLGKLSGAKLEIVTKASAGKIPIFVGKSRLTDERKLDTTGLENGAFRMASGAGWLALLGPDEDYVPIEPWGRVRGMMEAMRVNAEWDKITGDTFWDNCSGLYARYHR